MEKFELEVIHWIKCKNESYIKKHLLLWLKDMNHREKLVVVSGLNTFIYSYFLYVMNINLREVWTKNKELLATGDHYTEVVINYCHTFQKEYNYHYKEEIEQALDYIDSHLREDLTLGSIANHVHMSKNYLCKQFKKYTGVKFCHYVNHRRVDKAKSLLWHTDKPMDIIAAEVGYNSQTHFSTTFKKYTGKTPMAFRKLKRLKK